MGSPLLLVTDLLVCRSARLASKAWDSDVFVADITKRRVSSGTENSLLVVVVILKHQLQTTQMYQSLVQSIATMLTSALLLVQKE